jgi:hypothetical protein
MMSLLLAKIGFSGRLMIWAGGVAAVLIAATIGLWAHYGTTVFFEAVRSGWAACF